MSNCKGLMGVLACATLAAAFVVDSAALTVRGRAYALYVDAPSAGVTNTHYGDTGWLPPTGGSLSDTFSDFSLADVADVSYMGAFSDGDDCVGDSHVSFSNVVLLPGQAGEITLMTMGGFDDDECCEPEPDVPVPFSISGLTFGGNAVTVTGEFNQEVTIQGVGTLRINEVITHDDDDCDDDDFSVTGLHLFLANGEEIVLGRVIFESDDDCCGAPVPTRERTWGAIKALFRTTNPK